MDEETAKILQAISDMTNSAGWGHFKRDFSFQIEGLQKEINEPGGNEMKYSEGDLLKIKLKIMKEIIDYPDKYIAMTQKPKEPENEDPYEESNTAS